MTQNDPYILTAVNGEQDIRKSGETLPTGAKVLGTVSLTGKFTSDPNTQLTQQELRASGPTANMVNGYGLYALSWLAGRSKKHSDWYPKALADAVMNISSTQLTELGAELTGKITDPTETVLGRLDSYPILELVM